MTVHDDRHEHLHRHLARGVWALPAFGALLTVSNPTHQPHYGAGAVVLGRDLRATGPGLRAAGTACAVSLPLFSLAGPTIDVLQALFGAVFAVIIAHRLYADGQRDVLVPARTTVGAGR